MAFASLAMKNGIMPPKSASKMTEQDWFEFRNTLNPDEMGFDSTFEGYDETDLGFIPDDKWDKTNLTPGIAGASPKIQDNLTTRNYTNGSGTGRIKYIVVHYTANNGDTAKSNTNYFKSTYRGASAHYFVDEYDTIWRCVADKDISWHCGGGLQGSNGHTFYKICTNSNSIGIEMCSRKYDNGHYYFKQATIDNCIYLVKYLMNKYGVSADRVIRHYDVTGKICPEPFVNDSSAWNNFKIHLSGSAVVDIDKTGIYKVVNCDELNVRTGNSVYYDKVGVLKNGTQVEVIEINNGWAKIKYNASTAWVSMSYLEFVKADTLHWAQTYLDALVNKGIITDAAQWNNFDAPVKKSLAIALIDKASGGTWGSNEANPDIHWAQPSVISLCGKKIISDPAQWISSLDISISKALTLALVDKMTGGTLPLYATRYDVDHWGRNCLDSLCDKAIINTPQSWTDFEAEVSYGAFIALVYKALCK